MDKKVVEYIVVKGGAGNREGGQEDIAEKVNRYIKNGWQPSGGFTYDRIRENLYQPMVKYSK